MEREGTTSAPGTRRQNPGGAPLTVGPVIAHRTVEETKRSRRFRKIYTMLRASGMSIGDAKRLASQDAIQFVRLGEDFRPDPIISALENAAGPIADLSTAKVDVATRTSQAVLDYGRKLADDAGFVPPRPGESLPQGWVLSSRRTGESAVGINERLAPKEP